MVIFSCSDLVCTEKKNVFRKQQVAKTANLGAICFKRQFFCNRELNFFHFLTVFHFALYLNLNNFQFPSHLA